MKTQFLFACLCLSPFLSICQSTISQAATKVDAVNKDANTAKATANNVNNTAETIKSTAATIKELPGIFGIKKKTKTVKTEIAPSNTVGLTSNESNVSLSGNASTVSPTTTPGVTLINITGADYQKLSAIKERVKNCSSVSDAKMKFDVNVPSVITVSHKGTTEELFSILKEACKDLFSSKNLIGLDDGKIELKM